MGISSDQLQSWTNAGPSAGAINSHKSIRAAIEHMSFPGGKSPHVFLQGSYKNSTNIRGDGDVDVVVEWPDVFGSNLSESDKRRLGIIPAEYRWNEYDQTIAGGLIEYYGAAAVEVESKAIKVHFASSNYVLADVIPAFGYRLYDSKDDYTEGIKLYNRATGTPIVNFPVQHYENGNAKSNSTSGRFRETVRALKRARNYALARGLTVEGAAPSYFIECLLYNVADSVFDMDIRTRVETIAQFAMKVPENLKCQNGISALFAPDDTAWSIEASRDFGSCLFALLHGS